MKSPLTLTLAAVLAVSAAAPVVAQPYYSDSEYQQRLRDWQAERDRYEAQRQAYEADRRAYENRYNYDARVPYARDVVVADPYDYYRNSPCERRTARNNRQVAGTLIGALAGAALGANVAADKVRGEGIVLGAVVGGAIGAGVTAPDRRYTAACDASGYYYSYDQTYPYREDASYRGRSGRYDYSYYNRQRCRLAVAPTDWNGTTDYRYVRVCPDRSGRYRLTP
jgi:uncharacterized protein YcfJ